MIVAAAGAVDHERMLADASEKLASIPNGSLPATVQASYRGGIKIDARKLEQSHLVLGLEGVSYNDPERYAMQVFVNLLGGGGSSRLYQEAREKRGLCYSINSFHAAYQDTGLFAVSAGTDASDTEELVRVVIDQVHAAAEQASQVEVDRAKAQMKVSLLGALESASARADQLGGHLLAFGRVIPADEIAAKIDAVTVERTRTAGRKLVAGGKPTFAGVGEGSGLEKAGMIAAALQQKAA
jgi:predicted Zn-dependent peptidase